MVTAEYEASTLDDYQGAILPQIEHRGYCYFPVQENPEIAALSGGIFWSGLNYVYPVVREAESATGFFASGSGQKALSILPDELICEPIVLVAGGFYTMLTNVPFASYHDVFDVASTYTRQLPASELQLEQSVLNIFNGYQYEEFDMDVAFDFSSALDRLIQVNGRPAVFIINSLIKKHALNNIMISETLRALGRIEDENTKNERYELLIGSIKSSSAIIRDAAVSGLSFLDDKRALPQLHILFETETVPTLKNNIRVAIKGLEAY